MKKTLLIVTTLFIIISCSKDISSDIPNKKKDNKKIITPRPKPKPTPTPTPTPTPNKNNLTNLTGERKKLYSLIMKYRLSLNLPSIPISKSLNIVAQTHAIDLQTNRPNKGKCNQHSWSNKGKWIPVCYTSNHKQAKKMWSKPRELTSYKGNGYEISCALYNKATAVKALNSWKQSSAHHHVMINKGIWNKKWNAIGIGMYGNYAVVWFGNQIDPSK